MIRHIHLSLAWVFFFSFVPDISFADELSINALSRLRHGVKEHVLSNGMKVLFFKRGSAPVFAGIASVRVGGVNEVVGKTGASHLFEHMAFKGSEVIGTKDFSKESRILREVEALQLQRETRELTTEEKAKLASLNSQLEALWDIQEFTRLYRRWGSNGMNATTAKELTNYFSSFPTSAFEFWCWAQSERLSKPVMRQFYKERNVVLEERRTRYENSPSGKLYEKLLSNAFTIHPYRNPVIGYEDDVRNLTPDDVRILHEKYYVASNIVLGIVGDLEFHEVKPILEQYFSRIPPGPRPAQPDVIEPEQNGEKVFSVKYDAEPIMMMGYRKPAYPNKDEPAITLFLDYLLGSSVAPLYKKIVIEDRVASSLGYFEAPSDAYPNLAVIYGEPLSGYSNKALLKKIDKELSHILSKKISEKELKIIKRTIMKAALGGMKSNMGLAQELVSIQQKFGRWDTLLDWYEDLLSVTPEETLRVGRKYFKPANRTVGLLSRGGQ